MAGISFGIRRGDLLFVEMFCMLVQLVSFLGVRLSHGIPNAVIKGIQGATTHGSQVALPDVERLGTCVAVAKKRASMAHKKLERSREHQHIISLRGSMRSGVAHVIRPRGPGLRCQRISCCLSLL